jgi:hypothetical protein
MSSGKYFPTGIKVLSFTVRVGRIQVIDATPSKLSILSEAILQNTSHNVL